MKQFMEFSKITQEKIKIFEELLKKWQKSINLISSNTLSVLHERHVLDSAQLYPMIKPGRQVLMDMGSGAGFPGLILALLNQTQGDGLLEVHLVESDARKGAFIQEAMRQCHIQAVLHTARVEQLAPFAVDYVTARALKEVSILLDYATPFLTDKSVCLFLKGEKADEELQKARNQYDFVAKSFQSLTSPNGTILELTQIKRMEK